MQRPQLHCHRCWPSRCEWCAGDTVWTLQTLGITADAAANQTTRWLRYERWAEGALDATELMPFRLQHWSLAEVRDLVAAAGLVGVAITADHGAGVPGPNSEVVTVACRRPG